MAEEIITQFNGVLYTLAVVKQQIHRNVWKFIVIFTRISAEIHIGVEECNPHRPISARYILILHYIPTYT